MLSHETQNPTLPTDDVGNESMRVNSQKPDVVNDRDLMMVIVWPLKHKAIAID